MLRELGVLIPIIALLIPIVAIVMRHWRSVKMRELDLLEKSRDTLDGEARQRLERLEERVRVLERIATDRPLELAREIDRLQEGEKPGRRIAEG
ncbi:hypothetical protein [Thermaurantiacus tibetensis]|uniref:hypothetical protein n=1 Tax=Thermaurantiacus tibetensis TaxID=2759035 RepID=UPI00188E935A|nr:hypothetical protein [Thermaurantiacus tibetensis]